MAEKAEGAVKTGTSMMLPAKTPHVVSALKKSHSLVGMKQVTSKIKLRT
jgi:hypothetical protein